jgi:hypothetical protein
VSLRMQATGEATGVRQKSRAVASREREQRREPQSTARRALLLSMRWGSRDRPTPPGAVPQAEPSLGHPAGGRGGQCGRAAECPDRGDQPGHLPLRLVAPGARGARPLCDDDRAQDRGTLPRPPARQGLALHRGHSARDASALRSRTTDGRRRWRSSSGGASASSSSPVPRATTPCTCRARRRTASAGRPGRGRCCTSATPRMRSRSGSSSGRPLGSRFAKGFAKPS